MDIVDGLRLDGDEVRRRYDQFEKNSELIRWDRPGERSVPWDKLAKKEVSLEELTVVKLVLYVESYADIYADFLIEEFCPDKVFERFTRLWQREEQNHADQLKHYLTAMGMDPAKITRDLLEPRQRPFTIGYVKNPVQATAYTYIQELLTAFFYGEFAKKVKEPALKVLLSRIIADEWRHFHWYEALVAQYRKANPKLTYQEIIPIFKNFQMPGRTILGPAYDAITEEIAKFMGFGFEAVTDLGSRIIATFGTWDGGRLLLNSQYVKDYKAFFSKPMETDETRAIFAGFQTDIRQAVAAA
jgi:rubrerythrin